MKREGILISIQQFTECADVKNMDFCLKNQAQKLVLFPLKLG